MTLEERIQQLEDENLVLRDALGLNVPIKPDWKLTPLQGRILGVIAKSSHGASHARIHAALYGSRDDGGPLPKIIHVSVSHMRRKLRPFGIRINTNGWTGYWMDQDSREKVLSA